MIKTYKNRYLSLILVILLIGTHISAVNAEEVLPCSTNIIYLRTSLESSGTCLLGSVTGIFTGSGLHAIYYSEFQYLSSYGEYATIGDQRTFRSYEVGSATTFETYYCNPTPGVQYRFHTYMKVVNGDGIVKDSDIINSNTVVW